MSGFQSPITIIDAMDRINCNEYLLPAFQRDFVWKNGQIEKLFDSLMCGYPTSSMLFWKVKGETKTKWKFYRFLDNFVLNAKDYAIANVLHDAAGGGNDFYAILDGQQRLTALRIGIYGQYAYHEQRRSWNYSDRSFPWRRLYLCLTQNNGAGEDCKYEFRFLKNNDTNEKDFYTDSNNDLWFKVNAVVSLYWSGEEISDFFNTVTLTKEQRILINKLKNVIFTDRPITFYEEDEQNPDKAVKIFTRINSGGTFLSFSDIVFSLMVSHWEKDAKTEIGNLISQVAKKGFEIDKDYIVKAFLYLHHHRVKTEIRSFDKNFCSIIEQNWDKIRDSILSLFDLLRTFGMTSFNLTSNNATLPILYYLYHRSIYNDYAIRAMYKAEREDVKKWLLSVILRKVFGGQSDSILQQSRRAFTNDINSSFIDINKGFDGKLINDHINTIFQVDDEFIDELISTQKDDRYAFPILSLLYPNLDYKNNNFHKDHLHPESAYDMLPDSTKAKYPFSVYNSILNLQMLDSNQNQSKNDMPLVDWVDKECVALSCSKTEFLAEHLIPNVDLSLANFEQYAEERRKLLRANLKKL